MVFNEATVKRCIRACDMLITHTVTDRQNHSCSESLIAARSQIVIATKNSEQMLTAAVWNAKFFSLDNFCWLECHIFLVRKSCLEILLDKKKTDPEGPVGKVDCYATTFIGFFAYTANTALSVASVVQITVLGRALSCEFVPCSTTRSSNFKPAFVMAS